MNTNKGSIVKQSGNDAEGCRSEKILVQSNERISAIQCKIVYFAEFLTGEVKPRKA